MQYSCSVWLHATIHEIKTREVYCPDARTLCCIHVFHCSQKLIDLFIMELNWFDVSALFNSYTKGNVLH